MLVNFYSYQRTYEELKLRAIDLADWYSNRYQRTYEELKLTLKC